MNALTKRLVGWGVSGAIAVSAGYLVAPWEGGKKNSQGENIAYLDMVGVPTICAGFTHGVKLGDKKTDEECDKLLAEELTKFNTAMKKNVRVPLEPYEEAAYTSFVWNVGVGAWNSSTLLKKLNAGDKRGACDQLLRWNMAGGKVVQGLTNRRKDEWKVCTGGREDVNAALASIDHTEPLFTDGTAEQSTLETIILDEGRLPPPQQEINAPSRLEEPTKAIPEASSPSCVKRFLFFCLKRE